MSNTFDQISDVLEDAVDFLDDGLGEVTNFFDDAVTEVVDFFDDAIDEAIEFAGDAFEIIDRSIFEPIREHVIAPLEEYVLAPIVEAVFTPFDTLVFEPLGIEGIGNVLKAIATNIVEMAALAALGDVSAFGAFAADVIRLADDPVAFIGLGDITDSILTSIGSAGGVVGFITEAVGFYRDPIGTILENAQFDDFIQNRIFTSVDAITGGTISALLFVDRKGSIYDSPFDNNTESILSGAFNSVRGFFNRPVAKVAP